MFLLYSTLYLLFKLKSKYNMTVKTPSNFEYKLSLIDILLLEYIFEKLMCLSIGRNSYLNMLMGVNMNMKILSL